MAFESGPFLSMAFFCDRVIEGKDNVLSAIRIVDRWMHVIQGSEAPKDMPPVAVNLSLLIGFKSGTARGSHTLLVQSEQPSGIKGAALSFPVLFEGEDRGMNLNLQMAFQAEVEGLYWFDVKIDDQLVTRIPLRVVYQRLSVGS